MGMGCMGKVYYMRKRVHGVYGKVVYRERVYRDRVYGEGVVHLYIVRTTVSKQNTGMLGTIKPYFYYHI